MRSSTPSTGARLPVARSSLIGRAEELDALDAVRHDRDPALLTLVGPGGCGKTRLAIAHAEASQAAFAGQACFVPLAVVAQPVTVPSAVAAAVGLREQSEKPLIDALVAHLAPLRLLLLLDNCEHLLGSVVALVKRLLGDCPAVRIVATSRAPLGIVGEHVWQVPPLPQQHAVQLFVERASAARRTFAPDEHTRATIDALCRRLDGLPLAIELAAARINVLAVDDLLSRIDDRRLLGTDSTVVEPRQRTLEATIDWSHDVLSDADRQLFRRLAVFAGGCDVGRAVVVLVPPRLVARGSPLARNNACREHAGDIRDRLRFDGPGHARLGAGRLCRGASPPRGERRTVAEAPGDGRAGRRADVPEHAGAGPG